MQNKDKIILDLCGGSGAWSKLYKDNGYDVRVITLPEYDVRIYIPPIFVYGILCAPPCKDFSMVKSHVLKRDMITAMDIVNACMRIIFQCRVKFWALENPTGLLRRYLKRPRFTFHPWEFGDPWTKKTDIWGRFEIPKTYYQHWHDVPKNEKLYIRPGREKPSIAFLHKSAMVDIEWMKSYEVEDDSSFRAITPQGFAQAFFEANK